MEKLKHSKRLSKIAYIRQKSSDFLTLSRSTTLYILPKWKSQSSKLLLNMLPKGSSKNSVNFFFRKESR
jgi:hypothetical protein